MTGVWLYGTIMQHMVFNIYTRAYELNHKKHLPCRLYIAQICAAKHPRMLNKKKYVHSRNVIINI